MVGWSSKQVIDATCFHVLNTFTFANGMENKMTKDSKHIGGIMVGWMVAIMCSLNLLFGPEIMMIKKKPEGWLVGVWDGDSWDWSHPSWDLQWSSHQNPTRQNIWRCTIKLPCLLCSMFLFVCSNLIFVSFSPFMFVLIIFLLVFPFHVSEQNPSS